ncbi:sigma-70 family RNA polymerase sigma factor [Clostridium bovifaecis]|uniref:Sigma-70 family RNA polymerase sigma factor n=1 Tax=Clostridium bovifaecis TaxID=2184719 RepID=A0A6I6EYE7_9CLOT|nr:sigma-70 family RNA polymerase sigma factor [Clostridium bovifaecis]
MEEELRNDNEFKAIYSELWLKVYKYIYYFVQNKEEAEELSQDVFQKIFIKYKENKVEKGTIQFYIFKAAKNIVLDRWRQNRRRVKVITIEDTNNLDIDRHQENRITESMIVKDAMSKLDKDSKAIIQLRIIQGYSIKEVAKIMDKPEGTIKSLQFRALNKLKEILKKGEYEYV